MFEKRHRCFLDGCFALSIEKEQVGREEDIFLSSIHKGLQHIDSTKPGHRLAKSCIVRGLS